MVIMSADDSPLSSDICHNAEENRVECLQYRKCLKETSDEEYDWFNSFAADIQANDLKSVYALLLCFSSLQLLGAVPVIKGWILGF